MTERRATGGSPLAPNSSTVMVVKGPVVNGHNPSSPRGSATPGADRSLQRDEQEQQRARPNLDPPRAEGALVADHRLDETDDENTEQRSDNVARAAGEQSSTDDDRGDG